MNLSNLQKVVVGIVTPAWVGTLFVPGVTVEAKVGAQAIMALVVGRIFGIGIAKNGGE